MHKAFELRGTVLLSPKGRVYVPCCCDCLDVCALLCYVLLLSLGAGTVPTPSATLGSSTTRRHALAGMRY